MQPELNPHRIGAVSALSGVPVPTLRVWESRYGAFQPQKTGGRHRLFSDDDVLRATLLKQLTEAGHAIGTVATMDATRLGALLHRHRATRLHRHANEREVRTISLAVVGLPLAMRLQSPRFLEGLTETAVQVSDTVKDLSSACDHPFSGRPDILIVRVNTLHLATHTALRRLVEQLRPSQVIVLYSFGQERVVEAMKLEGLIVRREPVPDAELADLIRSLLLIDTSQPTGWTPHGAMIPPRKYSDQTLARVAGIPSQVLCECPRHVAELIAQLASFEQYSQECLNNSHEDAHVHAQLSAISGSARALFERALEMLAAHEGMALENL
jgi:MerR family transcriptional regulator, light-induced transcriptional regulator